MNIHPAANIFPRMSAKEFDVLKADIAANGLHEPIWTYQGQVLDGRHREQACDELGVGVSTRVYEGNDPVAFVVSLNLKRRHLNESQRAMVAAGLATREQGRPEKTGSIAGLSQPEAATLFNVSERLVRDAKAIARKSPELAEQIKQGEKTVTEAIRQITKAENKATVANIADIAMVKTSDLSSLSSRGMQFGTIYADPPWLYGNQGTRASTDNHYVGLTVDEIAGLPIAELAGDNAHLHLWTTNAFLFEAKRVMEWWGFEYKSCFIWVKPQIGMGNYWRVSHEFLLLGVRGSCPFADKSLRSWAELSRGRHSAKPDQIRNLIERASPAPRLELFGRRPAPGWVVWGNEVERTVFDAGVEELVG